MAKRLLCFRGSRDRRESREDSFMSISYKLHCLCPGTAGMQSAEHTGYKLYLVKYLKSNLRITGNGSLGVRKNNPRLFQPWQHTVITWGNFKK